MEQSRLEALRRNVSDALELTSKALSHDPRYANLICELSIYHTELEAHRQQLLESHITSSIAVQKFASLFDASPLGFVVVERNGNLAQYNRAANLLLSIEHRVRIGSPFALFIDCMDTRKLFRYWFSQTEQNFMELPLSINEEEWIHISRIPLGKVFEGQTLLAISDITEQVNSRKLLEASANTDSLTGIPNRKALLESLACEMNRAKRHDNSLMLAHINIDDFTLVNDMYGHEIGDKLLRLIVQELKSMLRMEDIIGRNGGDEFLIIVTDTKVVKGELPVVNRILETLNGIDEVAKLPVSISASVGVSLFPQSESVDANTLVQQADSAMKQAKQAGKNTFHIFDIASDKGID